MRVFLSFADNQKLTKDETARCILLYFWSRKRSFGISLLRRFIGSLFSHVRREKSSNIWTLNFPRHRWSYILIIFQYYVIFPSSFFLDSLFWIIFTLLELSVSTTFFIFSMVCEPILCFDPPAWKNITHDKELKSFDFNLFTLNWSIPLSRSQKRRQVPKFKALNTTVT